MIDVNTKEFARMLVKDSMKIAENEVVLIQCGNHDLDLAEECAIETRKAGAFPLIEIKTDRLSRAMFNEVPDEMLKKSWEPLAGVMSQIDSLIYIDPEKDPTNLKDVPPYKKASLMKARMPVSKTLRENKTKICLVLYPTPEMAVTYGVPWEYYHDRVWKSSLVTPSELYRIGKPIKEFIRGKDRVHVITEKGTDLTFSIKNRKIIICSGEDLEENRSIFHYNLNIPAGEVFTTIIEDSAEGTAVFDRVFVYGEPVDNLKVRFKKGSLVDFESEKGAGNFAKFYDTLTPKDKLTAEFGIGINPAVDRVIGCLQTDEKIAGTIHIAIGASIMYGGENDAPIHFDMIMNRPTVTIDDKLMMKEGKLSLT